MMRHSRPGLTLLEVVVSMAIFLMALVAIWQLLSIGTDRALDVKLQSQCSIKAQGKLSEVLVGAQPLAETSDQPFDAPDDHLKWSMKYSPLQANGLYEVQVQVKAEAPSGRIVMASISQVMLDPTMRGSTQDRPEPPPTSTPTQDAPTPAASSSTTPTTGGGGGGTPTTPTGGGGGGAQTGGGGGGGGGGGAKGGAKTGP